MIELREGKICRTDELNLFVQIHARFLMEVSKNYNFKNLSFDKIKWKLYLDEFVELTYRGINAK